MKSAMFAEQYSQFTGCRDCSGICENVGKNRIRCSGMADPNVTDSRENADLIWP